MRAFDSSSLIPTGKTVSSVEVKYLRVPTASAAIGVCTVFLMQRNNFIWAICNEYRVVDKSLARPTSRCILFDGENIPFDASLVIYIYIVIIFLQL